MFTLRRQRVPLLEPGSVPTSGSLRVLHLSDLHLVPSQQDKITWVRALADLQPDLVVTTGDNMAHRDAVPAVLEAYAPLLGIPGVFVFGSNDYYAPAPKNPLRYFLPHRRITPSPRTLPAAELASAFREAGWADLTNRRARLSAAGIAISAVGVDDPHLDRDRMPASSGAQAGLHLGVTHAPYRRVLTAMQAEGAALILAGHTHGGQVCVPGVGALVTNCDLDRGRVKGLHGWPGPRPDEPGGADSSWLHVSAGLGTSPYAPIRFACRPEATLLELLPQA